MTQGELERVFRASVTSVLGSDTLEEALKDSLSFYDINMSKQNTIDFAGLGVAMTANMVVLLSGEWGITPIEAWEIIVRIGIERKLPGMSTE